MVVISTPDGWISEDALRCEACEELGIEIEILRLPSADEVPYVSEEHDPYRLDFYYRCTPSYGFGALRAGLMSDNIKPPSREILQICLAPFSELTKYNQFSADAVFTR